MQAYIIKFWLPLMIASTIILLAVYAVVQQDIRIGANDPQIQLAEDGSAALAAGFSPASLVGAAHIDMKSSLATFVIIYDDSGKVLGSTGLLDGQVPILPEGVFDYARKSADDRITWQPASTTRVAAVVKHFEGMNGNASGFIVAGRSLREVENRERELSLMIAAAWVGLAVLTLIVVLYTWVIERRDI